MRFCTTRCSLHSLGWGTLFCQKSMKVLHRWKANAHPSGMWPCSMPARIMSVIEVYQGTEVSDPVPLWPWPR